MRMQTIRLDMSTLLAVNTQGEILLLRRPAHSSFPGHWQFPEGKQDAGETPEQALIREVREEVGHHLIQYRYLYEVYNTIKKDNKQYDVYRKVYQANQSIPVTLSHEHDAYQWMHPQEALDSLLLIPGAADTLSRFLTLID